MARKTINGLEKNSQAEKMTPEEEGKTKTEAND